MARQVRIKVKGAATLTANLQTIARKYPKAANAALFESGEKVRSIAIPLTPKDVGVLRNSAFVNRPVKTTRGLKVVIGYGGAAQAYAQVQHERTEFRHAEGGAKFLEKAIIEIQKTLVRDLARSIATKAAKINLRKP